MREDLAGGTSEGLTVARKTIDTSLGDSMNNCWPYIPFWTPYDICTTA